MDDFARLGLATSALPILLFAALIAEEDDTPSKAIKARYLQSKRLLASRFYAAHKLCDQFKDQHHLLSLLHSSVQLFEVFQVR